MEFIKGKEWLRRARTIDLLIWEKQQEIEAYESTLACAGVKYDRQNVITSPQNHFEMVMCDIAECFEQIKKLNETKIIILREINQKLDSLGECPERYVLRAFYVNGLSMSEIAKRINYDEKYCYELRKKGIEAL